MVNSGLIPSSFLHPSSGSQSSSKLNKPQCDLERMKLPQELIDLIIGEIFVHKDPDPFLPWRQRSPVAIYTLKSCTLLSRAFVRTAQKQLFLAIRVRPGLSGLLNTPHICQYVKHLEVEYAGNEIHRFLSSLPNLQAISLHSFSQWGAQLRASVLETLALPTLRCVQLSGYRLADAAELHAMLKNAVGLKQLALTSIAFRQEVIGVRIELRASRTIVIDSLRLIGSGLRSEDITSMLEAFTVVDISHLRRLQISRSAGEALLCVNAPTLEGLEIDWEAYCTAPYEGSPIGAHHLRSITITAPKPSNVASALCFLGNLADMAELEKVKLKIMDKLDTKDEAIWRLMDTNLSSAPHLRVVEVAVPRAPSISANVLRALDSSGWMSRPAEMHVPFPEYFDDGALIPLRWLAALAEKQILHISH
ncbi:hypothetical protein B0H16DRAFT_1575249 [Mycena metata]|uniref:Uncharacterized protein n=1 Tax=Mycena metata TaxID=1033252 RepID=A0AAD7I5Q3_9AGAR|nr:hypothetical protein B0H16DRAFT_1575249 [Mycena metata]